MRLRPCSAALVAGVLAVGLMMSGCRDSNTAETAPDQMSTVDAAPMTEDKETLDAPPQEQVKGGQPADNSDAHPAPVSETTRAPEPRSPETSPRVSGTTPTAPPEPRPASRPPEASPKDSGPTRTTGDRQPAGAQPTGDAGPGSPDSAAEPRTRGGRGGRGGLHERCDSNGDGLLTAKELPEELRDRIMRADANGDGAVSREELQRARPWRQSGSDGEAASAGRGGRLFERFDSNGDGLLTAQELQELPAEFSARILRADADGDRAVSRQEFEQARPARARGGRPRGNGE